MEYSYQDEGLQIYLREINKIPRLTLEEEEKLSRKIIKGDKSARNDLINANLRFVVHIAKQYRNNRISFLDLIEEGNLGLIRAAEKYDSEKFPNVKFSSYACWWIKRFIQRAMIEKSNSIKFTNEEFIENISDTNNFLEEILNSISLNSEMGRTLTSEESEIIKLSFGLEGVPQTFKEIGPKYNFSYETARKKYHKAIKKLEKSLI